jgi:copper(I)-binding protein
VPHITARPLRHIAVLVALTLTLALALALGAGGCGGGGPDSPAVVADAWAVPVGDGRSAAVYATITATGADELTGASVAADIARRAELVNPADTGSDEPGHLGHLDPGGSLNDDHSHTVTLRADTPVVLEPGRAYVALDLLAVPLRPGDTFEITLTFENSPDVRTDVAVRAPPG